MAIQWWQSACRLLLPTTCLLCNESTPRSSVLCGPCTAELPGIVDACDRCALPLPISGTCAHCLSRPPLWDAAIAAWAYSGTVPWLVRQFKFHRSLVHGKVLAHGLAERLCHEAVQPDVIAPVPLHPLRLRERGFNQSLEIARPVGRRLGVPVEALLAQRIISTAEQSGLDAGQRRRNVRGAFRVSADMRGLSVAVIDDVMTTGNTLEELVRALRRAGAQTVHVWVCARAEPPGEARTRKAIAQ